MKTRRSFLFPKWVENQMKSTRRFVDSKVYMTSYDSGPKIPPQVLVRYLLSSEHSDICCVVCRYTYKGLGKSAKKEVADAAKSGDAAWLKSAKSKVSFLFSP